jgi:RHS repeat-associated protein
VLWSVPVLCLAECPHTRGSGRRHVVDTAWAWRWLALAYTRTPEGLLKGTLSKSLPGEENTESTYDNNDRLTKAASTSYEYDAANNPTKLGAGTYKYNENDELETGPSLRYTYDELGERTKTTPEKGPATSYGYDQASELTSVERPKEGETSEIKDSYTYNGEHLRTSQTIARTTSYLDWDPTEELPLILNDGTNSYIYGPNELPIEQISSGGTVEYLHYDQAGSTRLLTGSTGTVSGKCTYSAYATPTCEGTATTPLGYGSEYTSSDTGLIYLRDRVYDSATAQFLRVDPLEALTGEPYDYVSDDPLTFDDPLGLAKQYCAGITVSGGIFTLNLEGCYVETPHGGGLTGTLGATVGLGAGANIHYGEGTSNACNAGEYGGPFVQYGGSAEFGSGGYTGWFTNWPSHKRRVSGKTTGETIGLGAEAGAGGSGTLVLPLPFGSGGGSSGGCGC